MTFLLFIKKHWLHICINFRHLLPTVFFVLSIQSSAMFKWGLPFKMWQKNCYLLILCREAENNLAVVSSHISTSEIWRKVKQRVGQTQFSDAVKKNYHFKCCFPGCKVNDPKFLVGSHIARWLIILINVVASQMVFVFVYYMTKLLKMGIFR